MSRFTRALVAPAFIASCVVLSHERANADFPMRPATAPLLYVDGVIRSWGVGNRSGGIVVQPASGAVRRFAVSDAIVVDGKPVRCAYPPKPGERPDPTLCDSWPPTLTLGKTHVRVAYWHDARAADPGARDVVASMKTLP